jgi:Rieske Fe-S protein
LKRRGFLGACGTLAAAVAAGAARARAAPTEAGSILTSSRVRLVAESGAPLRLSELVPHRGYVFVYPFESTPCFLLHLGRAVDAAAIPVRPGGPPVLWTGGVGPERAVVAYSAICPHAFTHPTRDVTMMRYYAPDTPATVAQRAGVVVCCVHGSAFDPGQGAVPLQPPAEVPLATILLEWDESTDTIDASGVAGSPVFTEFFRSFPRSSRQAVSGVTTVSELARYSRSVLSC